ncbi:MAG: DUF4446 family protein [Armatimonadetes bacterium]|nr:DUF4446 family protein [Armatimonadota bacterium]
MQSLFEKLNNAPVWAVLAVGLIALIALALAIMTYIALRKIRQRWAHLLAGVKVENIEDALEANLTNSERISVELAGAQERIARLEDQMESAKRYLAVVRYDAFDDVGGEQSFAFAMYDERGDGAVITSQVGRADCRVYAKQLIRGEADRELSQEESAAIEQAAAQVAKRRQ